jgi:hypothetical protein
MNKLLLTTCVITLGFIAHSQAQNLTYNPANPGWFTGTPWSATGAAPFDTCWTSGILFIASLGTLLLLRRMRRRS